MSDPPRNAAKGQTLRGEPCTVLAGAQVDGTCVGLLILKDGAREPDGVDLPYDQASALYEALGRALEDARERLD